MDVLQRILTLIPWREGTMSSQTICSSDTCKWSLICWRKKIPKTEFTLQHDFSKMCPVYLSPTGESFMFDGWWQPYQCLRISLTFRYRDGSCLRYEDDFTDMVIDNIVMDLVQDIGLDFSNVWDYFRQGIYYPEDIQKEGFKHFIVDFIEKKSIPKDYVAVQVMVW